MGMSRYCPVCGMPSRKFSAYGLAQRPDAQCMYCGAVERHRLVWLYWKMKTDLFDGRPKKMLHVAPEPAFEGLLRRRLGAGYLTADLFDARAMVKMDVGKIQYPNETFDVVYCSNVLEHVPDDRQALREFLRVLKPDGWAIVQVPVVAERTFEDPAITAPAERLKAYGQADHVRIYGPDFIERLKEAGFKVRVTALSDFLSPKETVRMGITKHAGEIYYCTKR
ncbi:MAG: methyltransferase domain-containing protein [Planctomycetes bacterium]|nr:methyltransferase domain-containing protein [Planctomycetota bacterium]